MACDIQFNHSIQSKFPCFINLRHVLRSHISDFYHIINVKYEKWGSESIIKLESSWLIRNAYLETHEVASLLFYVHGEMQHIYSMLTPTFPLWSMWPHAVVIGLSGGTDNNLESEHEFSDLSSHTEAHEGQGPWPHQQTALVGLQCLELFFLLQACPSRQPEHLKNVN